MCCPFVSRRAPFEPFTRGIEPRVPGLRGQTSTGRSRDCVGESAALLRHRGFGQAERPVQAPIRPLRPDGGCPPLWRNVRVSRAGTCRASDEQSCARLSVPDCTPVARRSRADTPFHPSPSPGLVLCLSAARATALGAHTHMRKRNLQLASRNRPTSRITKFCGTVGARGKGVPVLDVGRWCGSCCARQIFVPGKPAASPSMTRCVPVGVGDLRCRNGACGGF